MNDQSDEKSDRKRQRQDQHIKQIQELQQKLGEWENKYKRALADYQNLEKRAAQERSEWIKIANKELILRLLPVLDTLILAQSHVQDEGLRLSIKQFLDVLKNNGAERIETQGHEFDPKVMECVDTAQGEENRVLSEIRAGFTLHGEVVRPAQVKVGKKSQEEKTYG